MPTINASRSTGSAFHIRHIAHRFCVRSAQEIKPRLRDCKYPQGAQSRGSPRFLHASQDPDDLAQLRSIRTWQAKSGDGGAAIRHTMGCNLSARAEDLRLGA